MNAHEVDSLELYCTRSYILVGNGLTTQLK
jgi:hypothetical protein